MGFTTRIATSLSILLLCAVGATEARAAAGDLDRAFGGDGKVLRSFGASDRAVDLVVQPDRKVLALVARERSGDGAVAVVRFLRNGRLDRDFGRNGVARVDLVGEELGGGIALSGSGKPVISFLSHPDGGENVVGIARFRANGQPDGSLDDDGVQTAGVGSDLGLVDVADVALSGDDVVVAATAYDAADFDDELVAVRFQPNGERDSGFGDDGVATADVAGRDDDAYSVDVDSSGRVILAGSTVLGQPSCCVRRLTVARLESDGDPDPTLAGDGTLADNASNTARDVVAYDDGRIAVAGTVNGDFVAARYEEDGDPDDSFSGDGRQVVDFADATDEAESIALDGSLLVLAGTVRTARRGRDFGVARLRANGNLDGRFSEDGKRAISVGSGEDEGLAVDIDRTGDVVAGGEVERRGGRDTGVIRLQGKRGRR